MGQDGAEAGVHNQHQHEEEHGQVDRDGYSPVLLVPHGQHQFEARNCPLLDNRKREIHIHYINCSCFPFLKMGNKKKGGK